MAVYLYEHGHRVLILCNHTLHGHWDRSVIYYRRPEAISALSGVGLISKTNPKSREGHIRKNMSCDNFIAHCKWLKCRDKGRAIGGKTSLISSLFSCRDKGRAIGGKTSLISSLFSCRDKGRAIGGKTSLISSLFSCRDKGRAIGGKTSLISSLFSCRDKGRAIGGKTSLISSLFSNVQYYYMSWPINAPLGL